MISEALKKNSTLILLNLEWNQLKSEWTNDNENDIKMKWIDNNIGDEGAKMIGEGLKSNSTLTSLWLNGDGKKKGKKEKGIKEREKEMCRWNNENENNINEINGEQYWSRGLWTDRRTNSM